MTHPEKTRRQLLAALAELGQLRPEWRLGQTMANLAMTAGRLEPGGVWDLEDQEALAATWTLIQQYSGKASSVPELGDAPAISEPSEPSDAAERQQSR